MNSLPILALGLVVSSYKSRHGIRARTVKGAPTFAEVLPMLKAALAGPTVYQHSGFDRSAVAAACIKVSAQSTAPLQMAFAGQPRITDFAARSPPRHR